MTKYLVDMAILALIAMISLIVMKMLYGTPNDPRVPVTQEEVGALNHLPAAASLTALETDPSQRVVGLGMVGSLDGSQWPVGLCTRFEQTHPCTNQP